MQRAVRFAGVYVTHDQLEAMQLADRMAIMNNGRIVQLDAPIGIYRNPVSRYVACFVGQANELDATVSEVRADGREVVVATPVGTLVAAHARDWTPAAGERVRLVVRPEDLKPLPVTPPAGQNALRGTVEVVMFSGAHVEYRVRAGPQLLHVRSENRGILSEGTEVAIAIDPVAVYVFPEKEDR